MYYNKLTRRHFFSPGEFSLAAVCSYTLQITTQIQMPIQMENYRCKELFNVKITNLQITEIIHVY